MYADSEISFKDMITSQNNPMLRYFPQLIQDLVKEGFPVQIHLDQNYFGVADFYKTGELKLVPDEHGKIIAFDKDGNKGEVKTPEDIVKLNFSWWIASQTKQGYPQLTQFWTNHFLKRKWLKIIRVYAPDLEMFEQETLKAESVNKQNQDEVPLETVELSEAELEKLTAPDDDDFNEV